MEETEKCHIINCYKFSIKPFVVFEAKQVDGLNFLDFTSDFFFPLERLLLNSKM